MKEPSTYEKCCADCNSFGYEHPCHDQPYPEFWCGKGHWDGICTTEDLYEPIDCDDFNIEDDKMLVPDENAPEWMKKRYQISMDYCEKKGWDIDRLEITQIMEIRNLPEWIEAGKQ